MIDRRTSHPMKAGDKNLKAMIGPRWRLAPMALGLMALTTAPAWSLPVDPTVVAGSATISQPRADALLVNQSSQSAQIDWRSFDIAHGERVQFVQPNASSVIFNKVLSADPSSIFGTISANGRVFLINPAGIIFGPTAVIDTGSLVATALDVRLDPANPGRFSLVATTDRPGRIENQGRLSAAHGGVVALIGGQVVNSGSILTPGGTTALAAAARVTLDFAGDKLLGFEVDPALARASIQHSGRIETEGGDAVFEVRARDALLDTVLNVEGVVRANRLVERNGTIHIDGGGSGVVRIGGQLDASGSSTAGGLIEVTGDKVLLDAGASLIASGATGGGTIHVGGDWQGSGPLRNASMTHVAAGTRLEADATESGNGGEVVVWSNENTRFFGHAQTQGGLQGGDGGRGEVSGKDYLDFRGTFSASAPHGKAGMLLLDPLDITISDAEHANGNWVEQDGAFKPSADPSVLSWETLRTALGTSDVTVTTADNGGEASGNITVAAASPDLASSQSLTLETADGGKININAAITNTGGGSLIYDGPVMLGANTTLSGTNVSLLSTVDGAHSLTIKAGGTTTFGGAVGHQTALASLSTDVGGTTAIKGGEVRSTGAQTYGDNVVIDTKDATLSTINNLVAIAGAMTLTKGLTVSSGAGNVTFSGTIDGPGALAVNSSGKTTFSHALGAGTALASLTTDAGGSTAISGGAVRTSGEQSYGDEVTLSVDTTLKGSTVTTKGTLVGGSQSLTVDGDAVFANTLSDLNKLAVKGTTKLDIGNLVTVGEQIYGGAVTLGTDTTLAGSTVKMQGGVNGREHHLLIVGNAVLGGTLSGLTTLGVSKSTTITGGEVRSTGAQTYGDTLVIDKADATLSTTGKAVSIAGATTLSKRLTVSSGAGDVTFSGAVDGPGALVVNSSGTTTFSQALGENSKLLSLTTDAGGSTAINGGSVKTSGAQTYGDAVTLGVDSTLTGSTVTMKGTLAGDSKSLRIDGNAVFGDAVGDTVTGLQGLAVTGKTTLNIGDLVTVGEQSYDGEVTLGADTALTGSKVKTLGGVTGGEHSLSIVGDAMLAGTLRGLTTLTVSKSTTITGGTVTSSGKQEYSGDVTIDGATKLSSGEGDVTFHGKVFGPGSLSLNSQGTVTFNDAVGDDGKPLQSLATDVGGNLLIKGGLVRTIGKQSYADGVELKGDTILHVTGSSAKIPPAGGEQGFSFGYYDNAVELRNGGSITNESGSRLAVVVDGPGSVDLLGLKPKDGSSTTPSLAELITKAAATLAPSSNAFAGLMGWKTGNDLQGEVTVITVSPELLEGKDRSLETQHLVGVASPKIEIAKFGGDDKRADIGILADSVLLMTRALPISRPDGMGDNGIVKATAALPAEAVARHPYVPALTVLPVEHEGQGASQPYYYGGADKDLWIPVELGVDSQNRGLVVFLPPQNAGRDAKWLYLGGPEELKPIMSSSSLVRYGAASVPVIYNGEIIPTAQFVGFEASLVQLLSDIRREQLERGYANESIPARLRTGVVMETGLGSPAVDEFEGVALPARCTGTVSASGMSCAN